MSTLSDMGRRASEESKTFVRKISLLKRGKSSSSGGSSPVSGSTEQFEGGTTSPTMGAQRGAPSPTLQKRFSLLSRHSSTSVPSSPTPEQQPLQPAGAEESGKASPSTGGAGGGGGGGGGGGKKGKGGAKGRNGKGKKVSKKPQPAGKRSPH